MYVWVFEVLASYGANMYSVVCLKMFNLQDGEINRGASSDKDPGVRCQLDAFTDT